MKKLLAFAMSAVLFAGAFTGCANGGGFDTASDITVITREEGSGTRGAFIELFGVEEKDADGNKVDKTISTADTQTSTGVVLTSVEQNVNAIGYISMGSLKDTVKALKINGAEPSVENIKSGKYEASRPFNIAESADASELAQDFVDFILSEEGQQTVEKAGFIASVDSPAAYDGKKLSGTVTVSGSSSVTPVMEKLKEAYEAVNTNAKIEINMSDSTTGMSDAAAGNCDIGMASRELKDSELEQGLTPVVIAIDGIAVIVNNENTIDDMTKDDIKKIYTGEAVKWSDITGE
ncbi:MAG TPA: phosphate ABC transporter substrate-binding protein [Ruminococcus sp.]|nr:phosphate ABC transporter substrate-binding protein [Ruminococcus sp.]